MNKKSLAEQLFFAKEAAEYLDITVQRLNKLIQEGKIVPLKKNSSGTIFHIDELNRRKEELEIFTNVGGGGDSGMFVFDTKTKQEALNYSTLLNALNTTELRLEPQFNKLSELIPIDIPIDSSDICRAYADFFGIEEKKLLQTYKNARKAFLGLKKGDEIIKRGTTEYPPLLAETEQAPRFLYIRGKKALLYEKRTVALVGSRQASENAKTNTRRLAEALGRNGITVVSGLAKGIDVTAHLAALEHNFNTIAVIGTNLNQYYPSENKNIQLQIEKKGLIVSQFPPSSQTQRWFFPLRNGVMSGLSLATVIMEAGETSGALKQADFALKQGRQIIIPKNVLKTPKISWPQKYVKKGASVVETPIDVLKVLAENNIFNPERTNKSMQMTLKDYLSDSQPSTKKHMEIAWTEPLTIEE